MQTELINHHSLEVAEVNSVTYCEVTLWQNINCDHNHVCISIQNQKSVCLQLHVVKRV